MKVVDFLKERKEFLAQNPFELKDWLSPTIRDYWIEFLNKANHSQLGNWVRDQQVVGDPTSEQVAEKPIELSPKAAVVFEQLQHQLGLEVHIGQWLCVDQERINAFAQVTHDHQWLHTDPERAQQESPFKTTIAHGFLTLSLLPFLTQSVSDEEQAYPDAKMVVNYGLDKVRFPYPVKVNNKIRARTTLVKVTPIKRGLELVKEIKVEIEGCRRPGCVTESITRLYF
ncbi:MaoC family dehydratase [Alginatibacterium sediminis]|uniref:MaoC family dehydratase n=1 Tax=Alginatibacterium sediminis TaxID=2164068 RepID=A0A420EJI6_9ALTE|nr:MaoC family dehydratase [Alginatibacterium sediminis]RKF20881.1 MaoC family dehydratase [Alginatibacterium sediminis]